MLRRIAILASATILVRTTPVFADGVRAGPDDWLTAWDWDLLVIFNLAVLAWIYARGIRRVRRRAGEGKVVNGSQVVALFAALAVVFLALLSPLDALSADLSWAHMTQHMLLMNVAAPLFVLGSPAVLLAWGLPRDWRRAVKGARLSSSILWSPLLVWLLYAVTLWGWHHPMLYHAALRDPLIHDVQHLTFFGVAFLFWRSVLDPLSRRRLHPATAVVFLFTASLHATLLGVFMTLAPRPWYSDYLATTQIWGLTPLEDQQLAGLIMWVPACLLYPAAAVATFAAWLSKMPVDEATMPANRAATGGSPS